MAAGPFAMQIFAPALPVISAAFAAPAWAAVIAMSGAMAAIALATLAYGAAADRLGRRPTLLFGQFLFLLGSVIAACAPSMGVLVIGRILQSVGGAAGLSIARPILIDLYDHDTAARRYTTLIAIMVAAPMMAPALGGVLTDALGWRAVFVATIVMAAALCLILFFAAPETRAPRPRTTSLMGDARVLFAQPLFLGYTAVSTAMLTIFFCFVAAAPLVTQNAYGLSPTAYGFWFASMPAVFMASGMLANRLSHRLDLRVIVRAGAVCVTLGAALAAAFVFAGVWTPAALFGPGMVIALGNGLALARAQTAAAAVDLDRAGAASGLSGFCQMACGALGMQIVGGASAETPYALAIAALTLALFGLAAALWTARRAA